MCYQPTDKELKPLAHQIAIRKKQVGDEHWNDSFGNWMQARDQFLHDKELQDNITRGDCGS